jgi:hypothetical protein
MSMELIAAFAQQVLGNAPEWIMFAPAGRHNISAKVNGRPSKVTVTVDEAAAKALQSDLEARKATPGSQPFFDLHHDAREASAYPEEFEWRDDGIWARVRWTPAGLAATKADPDNGILPSVRYFSPRCAIANGRIVGLMDAASGNAAGGLVSDPAFTQIALVASLTPTPKIMDKKRLMKMAGYADDLEDVDEMELMSKLEAMCGMSKKLDAGAMPEKLMKMEAAKASAESERDAIKAELAAAKSELEAARTEAAESFVAELVASGKVPPKSETRKEFLRKSFLADPEGTKAYAAELTASNPGSERLTDEGQGDKSTTDKLPLADRIEKRAHELAASKSISYDDAYPQATRELLK